MRASVVPRERANWSIAAGPYVVRVVGTEFDVSWDPEAEQLSVQVRRGAVEINGPVLLGGQHVSTGQLFSVDIREKRAVLREIAQAATPPESAEVPASEQVDAEPVPEASAEATSELTKNEPPTVTWQSLAKQGQYKKALAIIDRTGYDRTEQSLSALELLRLADVARMGDQPDRAMGTLQLVRQRFPGSRAASEAAYTLGLTEFDQRGRYAAAASWFSTYLREQPAGPLAREALGRLMEAQLKLGQRDQAKATAERYLQAYPKGPHRDVAIRLTGR
jgi:TolA-binding protein